MCVYVYVYACAWALTCADKVACLVHAADEELQANYCINDYDKKDKKRDVQ